jgi:cytochrome c-type biogenesis protein CcmH
VSTRDLFYFFAGALAMFAALLVVRPLLGRASATMARASLRTIAYGAAAVIGLSAAALGVYFWSGTPRALDQSAVQSAAPHTTSNPSASPGTMEEATKRLAARLESGGGSAEDWQLLAKSYEFLGRTDEARRAAAQADALGGAAGASAALNTVPGPASPTIAPATAAKPPDAASVRDLAKADQLRRARDFAGACAIYARLAGRGQMGADGWADYADASASLHGGSLKGEPAGYIDQALRLDPQHPKALWLQASLLYEQHRYADALVQWRRLAGVLPPDSPDQRIVASNIEEAARLAGGVASQPPVASTASAARITGTVELAAALAARAPAGATLFIYARSPGAAGPPLAVLRVAADHWPVAFVLDDSQSMIPGRVLSGASLVSVEARISRSGNALPQSGDLVGTLSNIDPHAGRTVRIAIDHEIG